ncbi:class I SAM-dependent methyltransferase [Streptomyces sp. NPDC059788]|uniref:class I SAM-dependent methyltransferase n=1 Tax=Streptomyces sp. NPDC059788 TaxID=3346948 RepID=UPI0036575CA7
MLTDDHAAWGHASSTGLGFTHHTIVDAHFAACRDPYLELLARAGLRPGRRVLDVGCGSGEFLPHLARITGEGGHLSAVDLADEHVALVRQRSQEWDLPCSFDVRQGSALRLPYADNSFDAVWCANTVQYLDDDQLATALSEMRRVVRAGGIVAVKELDASLITARPAPPYLFSDFFRAAAAAPGYARQLLRTRDLHRWLREAGLSDVRQQTVLIEHHAPLSTAAREFYGLACARLADQARTAAAKEGAGADAVARDAWDAFADPNGPEHPLDAPYAYISEGNALAVGIVPSDDVASRPPAGEAPGL